MAIKLPGGKSLFFPSLPETPTGSTSHPKQVIPLPESMLPFLRMCHRCRAEVMVGIDDAERFMALDPYPWRTGFEVSDDRGSLFPGDTPTVKVGEYHNASKPLATHSHARFLLRPHTCSLVRIDHHLTDLYRDLLNYRAEETIRV
jgi:hypothetical protein